MHVSLEAQMNSLFDFVVLLLSDTSVELSETTLSKQVNVELHLKLPDEILNLPPESLFRDLLDLGTLVIEVNGNPLQVRIPMSAKVYWEKMVLTKNSEDIVSNEIDFGTRVFWSFINLSPTQSKMIILWKFQTETTLRLLQILH
jgi:hypothetical protein